MLLFILSCLIVLRKRVRSYCKIGDKPNLFVFFGFSAVRRAGFLFWSFVFVRCLSLLCFLLEEILFLLEDFLEEVHAFGVFVGEGVDVSHPFFFENFVCGDEDSCFFDLTELVVDGGSEDSHRGAESHVGIDQGRNVEAQFSHLGVEDSIVCFEVFFGEECFQFRFVRACLNGCVGRDKFFVVREVFVQEEENHVPGFWVERGIHGHFAEEIFQVRHEHRERTESVPEIVEGKESFAHGACALIFQGDEGAPQFHGLREIVLDEFFREVEHVGGSQFRLPVVSKLNLVTGEESVSS